jgi:DNA (cytosine-5)-methyltransferase 1
MKILNLYAGIGGNRKLWGEDHQITAVELNPEIAKIYSDFFPNDEMIIADAHQYLLDHYKEFDFIWSSPPCPTHSGNNKFLNAQGLIRYPDMQLWQEIIFLRHFYTGKFVIENVIPYYEPFIIPYIKIDRHLFWSNFNIYNHSLLCNYGNVNDIKRGSTHYGISLKDYKLKHRKDVILRNMVNPEIGLHILDCAMSIIRSENVSQLQIF